MKDNTLRRSLSERKIAKKDRREKTRSEHLDNSLTPISIIGGEAKPEVMTEYEAGTLDRPGRGKKTKFWKLKVKSTKILFQQYESIQYAIFLYYVLQQTPALTPAF